MESPSSPFVHKSSLSSLVSICACFFLVPTPWPCSPFISASRDAWNHCCKNIKFRFAVPPRYLIRPAAMWCRLLGRKKLLSCLRISRMKQVSQCWSSWFDISVIVPICTQDELVQWFLHSFHKQKQYLVSSSTFLWTPSIPWALTSSSVCGGANLRVKLVDSWRGGASASVGDGESTGGACRQLKRKWAGLVGASANVASLEIYGWSL